MGRIGGVEKLEAATRVTTQLRIAYMRALNVTPHIAQSTSGRRSALDVSASQPETA